VALFFFVPVTVSNPVKRASALEQL